MKTIGIQIKSSEAIIVVLEKDANGTITQTNECAKFEINDPTNPNQVKQFRDQVNTAFDSTAPTKIGIMARNAKGKGRMAPSPGSFKLEGVIQLYDKIEPVLVWPQTLASYFKKNSKAIAPAKKYQDDAFDVAYFLINQ